MLLTSLHTQLDHRFSRFGSNKSFTSKIYGKCSQGISTLLLLIFVSLPLSQAADIRFAGALLGGIPFKKKVVSMRESRFREMVKQKTDFSCGAAALATILKYGYGEDISETEILKEIMSVNDANLIKKKGVSFKDIKNYLESRGMKGKGYRVKPGVFKMLKIPVMVLLNIGGYTHFVVVKKAKDGKVYIADPSLGNKVMPEEEFVKGWWKNVVFVVMGKPFDQNSPLLALNDPHRVNKERLLKYSPRTIDPIDFGLVPDQMF